MKYPQWVTDKILDEIDLADFDIYQCESCGKYFEEYDYNQHKLCQNCRPKCEWEQYDDERI